MADTVVDEVVTNSTPRGGTRVASRPVVEETISESGGVVSASDGVEEDHVREGGIRGRVLSESTKKLLAKLEAGKNADDPDDEVVEGDEPVDPDDEAVAATGDEEPVDPDDVVEPEPKKEAPPANDEWREKALRLEATNRQLLARAEARERQARPADPRVEALLAAEQAYVDEGPIAAVRKFISIVLDSKHDAQDVDTELAGLYTDLTARDLNVPLEQSHLALREASRARLALARDKRERKAQSDAATSKPEQADDQPTEQAITYIDSKLRTTKSESGKAFADEFPMLMTMAEHLDGASPAKLLGVVIKRECQIGNLDPKLPEDVLIRTAAQRIEDHYRTIWKKFPGSQPDITTSGGKQPATAKTASNDQRQATQARTINNATASVAPASSPKTKKIEPKTEERPKFKSKREAQDYALRHLPK